MADITIGGKIYSGITTLKIPLADGSGYALFSVSGETGEILFDSYSVFVPENVSDEWKITGDYGTLNMSTAEFLELFYDGFVSAPPSGMTVTKKSVGKDETGQYDMWEYDFCPVNYSRTILLSSGMHTYELPASFGLANFIGHLYTDTGNNAFDYIRNNVRIKVIPVVNPWGFNQYPKKYGNVNGVNPNRNFDLDGAWATFPDYTPAQNEWNVKGESPFCEAEAHNLARWAEANWNAEFWIDCHTGEGYSDKDLWVYYASDAALLDRINAGISKIETWFKETYGTDCVTTRTIDSDGSIRLFWAEKCGGIPGMTLEQAPKRTTFGTAATNEAADISNYSTNISTFVQEFLLEKYRSTETVAIQSVSLADVTIPSGTPSLTINATITPANTTQNKFEWTSSNENVIKVYGGTKKAVLVRVGTGTATLTCKNRYDNSVVASCTVNATEAEIVDADADMLCEIGSIAMSGDGSETTSTARLRTTEYYPYTGNSTVSAEIATISDGVIAVNTARMATNYIAVTAGASISIECLSGYYVKAWFYDSTGTYLSKYLGALNTNSVTGSVPSGAAFMRISFKKSDATDFTSDELLSTQISIDGVTHTLQRNRLTIDATECPYQPLIVAYDANKNFISYGFQITGDSEKLGLVEPQYSHWLNPTLQQITAMRPDIAYVRYLFRNSDDSNITTPVSSIITIDGVKYAIKLA